MRNDDFSCPFGPQLTLTLCHRYRLVRGALDFNGVTGRTTSRSLYGGALKVLSNLINAT